MGTPSPQALDRQPSNEEPPSAPSQDTEQEESASRTPGEEGIVWLQHQTSEPACQDSGTTVEISEPSTLSPRAFFRRSKSLFVGFPLPSSAAAGISESGSWSQRLRDLSFTQRKQLAEKEKLLHTEELAEGDPHFTVGSDEEEEH